MTILRDRFWTKLNSIGCQFCITLVIIFFGQEAKAQKSYFPDIKFSKNSKITIQATLKRNIKYDSLTIEKEINQMVFKIQSQSYLEAEIIDYNISGDTIFCLIDPGHKTSWKGIQIGPIPEIELKKSKVFKISEKDQFSFSEITKIENKLLSFYENNGFPFASLYFDSLTFENNIIKTSIMVKRGPLILFDSLKILGNSRIRPVFLSKFLRIGYGNLYSTQKVLNSDKLLRQLPYVAIKKGSATFFKNNKAQVFYFIDEKKSNQADGIIGFLPNSGANKTLLFTGEVNLLLRNLFGRGLNLKGEWKSFQSQSQSLSLDFYYPNVLGSVVDLDFGIDFLKQDTTFRSFQYNLKFSYQSSTFSKFSMFGGVKTSDLISTDRYKFISTLPQYADFTYSFYGIGYVFNNLDDYYYPKSGWLISCDGSLGSKSIRRNAGVNELAYKSVNLNTTQYSINFSTEKHTRIIKNTILYTRIKGGRVSNENLLRNDMYRLGGFKSLRGFNENDYFVSDYLLANIELRQFTEPGSYLFLFFDQALYASALTNAYKEDAPFGFGAGASLTTSAGVFNFAYGLGQSIDQKINFNLSKIHFGYTSRF